MVRCQVIAQIERADSKRKTLALSMRSSLINRGLALKHLMVGFPISGCVTSKEDHGYIVSAGVSGVTFFLPFNKAGPGGGGGARGEGEGEAEGHTELLVGQPIEAVVEVKEEVTAEPVVEKVAPKKPENKPKAVQNKPPRGKKKKR